MKTYTSGTVASTTINVRLRAGLAINSYDSKVINITSTAAISKSITCSGIVYSSVDSTPPSAPGIFTLNSRTDTSLNLSWASSSTTGIDLTGYLLVRYSNSPALETGANPVQGTTYSIGNTYTTGTPPAGSSAKVGTVVYLGSNLTFTDTNLMAGTTYYYKVYAYDLARNYSAASSDSSFAAKTRSYLATPVATAATSTATGFTANWQHVANANSYSLNLYTAATAQSNIVGWNFDTNLLATTTSANNTNNLVVQSKGTAQLGIVSSNTSVSATTSAWLPSGTVPNLVPSGTNWEIVVNTLGYTNTTVSSKMYASQALTAARDFKVQYKIGSTGTYADVPSGSITVARDWTTGVLNNLALPAVCDNQTSVYLRWINYTTIATDGVSTISNGGISLDDIYVKGNACTTVSGYPQTVAVTGTPAAGDTLTSNQTLSTYGTYYYDVVANPGQGSSAYVSSLNSNTVRAEYIDNVAPASPGAVTVNAATSGLAINWDAATSVDGGGYMVVRYASEPKADNDPVQKTAYVAGNTITNGTSSLTGTVLYVGTNLTATDTNLSSGTSYYYKVYTVDQATNYSDESSGSGITAAATLTAPVATVSSEPTSTGFTANWGAVTNATNYDLYLYDANTPSTIVGWNFDTSLAATTTSANNTNNLVVQSKGTAALGIVSSNTAVTGTTSAWTPSGTAPNLVASGTNWEIVVNTLGYRNTTVSSKMYASQAATAARDFKVQYKIGATGTYADVPSGAIVVGNNWTTGVLSDLALPAACDDQASVYLRWINYTTLATDGVRTITAGGISLDDVSVRGNALNDKSGYPVTVSSTSKVLSDLSPGVFYYNVIAKGDGVAYTSSAKSNTIASIVSISQDVANYKSVGDATTSNIANWQYFDGISWLAATAIPTSANSVTVSSGNLVTLGAGFEVGSGKTMTVNGTLDLAGYMVSGAGSFVLATAGTISTTSAANYATLKLGNNISIANGITTATRTFGEATNYVYNGEGIEQNFSSLPTPINGNITISNTTGVYLVNHTTINKPGLVTVAEGAKLWFGDGAATVARTIAGTYNLDGTGAFTAGNGSTLVVTGSKGLSWRSGNMSLRGTRTWGSDINFLFYKNDGYTVMQMGDLFATNSLNTQSPSAPEITSINNLEVNNPYGVYLGCINPSKNPLNTGFTSGTTVNGMITDYAPLTDITIKGNLTFISGKLIANKGTLELNADGIAAKSYVAEDGTTRVTSIPTNIGTATVIVAGSIIDAGTTGTISLPNGYTNGKWVVGNLKKATTSGNSPSFTYAIGDATTYCPLAIEFSGNTSATGGLTARSYAGLVSNAADSSIDDTKKVNRYWSLTNTDLAGFGTYQATFNYANADNDSGTDPSNYVVRRFDNDSWTNVTISGTPTTTATTATEIAGFGNFIIGQSINAVQNASAQSFCGSATVADLVPYSGTSYRWYTTETGGTALDASTALTTGTYYVSMAIFGNSETARTAVTVTVNANSNASVVKVSSIAELQTKINNANCGDIFILADGHYTDTTLNINSSNITVKAATNGGVYLDGTNDINITGNNMKFNGFQFTSGDIGANYLIQVSGSHNTLSQLNFDGYNAKKFIEIQAGSQYNTVEYSNISKLADDNEAEVGCAIQIHASYTTPGYHKIRYCSFQNFGGNGGDYGNEPIRIGLSTENAYKSRSIVEYCYFNNTGLGDSESVSIKSQENTVRFCTFENQQNAMLVFRNGDNNVAYSNFFINAGGIRVKEANNIYCYNNYFQNSGTATTGTNRATAVFYDYDTSTYPVVLNNINFVHNTFYDSGDINFGGTGATNNTWANNIFKKATGSIFTNANAGTSFAGNIYQGTLGFAIASGVAAADPLLATNSDNYFGLSAESPAIDAASSSYPTILHIPNIDDDYSLLYDVSGQSRPALATSKDVGCDEFTSGAITNRPLGLTNVGPAYLEGPATAAPNAVAQVFCTSGTVADLVATGIAIQWYTAATGGDALLSDAVLTTKNYFASQTLNGAESARTEVAVTIQAVPNAGTDSTLNVATGVIPTDAQLFAALTGADTGGSWTNNGLIWTYTVSAISPCTVSDTATVTVSEVIPASFTVCAGTTINAIVGTSSLKFYADVKAALPLPLTTVLGAKPYFVTQLVGGVESTPRKSVPVVVNALPAAPSALVLTNDNPVLPATATTAVTALGLYAGTETPFKLTATAVGAASYKWILPAGVERTNATGTTTDASRTSTDAFIYVKFSEKGASTPLVMSVQSVNANGCTSVAKPTAALTRLLPAAPAAIIVTDASLPVAEGKLPAPVKSFGMYMGSPKVLTLTATPSPTATSYIWELPAGVTQLSGGNSSIITVNFDGVTNVNTTNYLDAKGILTHVLRIGVNAVNGVGASITDNQTKPLTPPTDSKAKLLVLTATAPTAPALVLNNPLLEVAVGAKPLAITVISKLIGQGAVYRLTVAVSPLASSYSWELPSCVTRVTDVNGLTATTSTTSIEPFIFVKFDVAIAPAGSIYFGVKAVNGVGSSNSSALNTEIKSPGKVGSEFSLLRLLTVAPAAPALVLNNPLLEVAPGAKPVAIAIISKLIGQGAVYRLNAAVSPLANSYSWELPSCVTRVTDVNGLTATTSTTSIDPFIFVKFDVATAPAGSIYFGVKAVNGVGSSNSSIVNTEIKVPGKGGSEFSLLKLITVVPAAPASLILNDVNSVTPATPIAIVSKYIASNATLKLTAGASVLANAYSWELPSCVTRVTNLDGLEVDNSSRSTDPFIYVKFNGTKPSAGLIYFGVKAVNGVGSSFTVNTGATSARTDKVLAVTAGLPSAVAKLGGSLSVCDKTEGFSYTITAPLDAKSYIITAPLGSVVSSTTAPNNTSNVLATSDLTFKVVYAGTAPFYKTDNVLLITSVNDFGVSAKAFKSAALTKQVNCNSLTGTARMEASTTTDNINVIASPNPSTDVFRLDIQTSGKGKATTGVQVYDMTGRLIEQRQVESNSIEVGNNYPTGIYNVIVNQGENTKTLRVIKN